MRWVSAGRKTGTSWSSISTCSGLFSDFTRFICSSRLSAAALETPPRLFSRVKARFLCLVTFWVWKRIQFWEWRWGLHYLRCFSRTSLALFAWEPSSASRYFSGRSLPPPIEPCPCHFYRIFLATAASNQRISSLTKWARRRWACFGWSLRICLWEQCRKRSLSRKTRLFQELGTVNEWES